MRDQEGERETKKLRDQDRERERSGERLRPRGRKASGFAQLRCFRWQLHPIIALANYDSHSL